MTSLKRASFHATVGWVIMVCTALSYSSYFSYRNTNSDHKWACSAARRTFKIKNYFHQMQSPGLSLRECRARDSPRLLWMWPSPTCIGKWKKNKTKRNPRSLNVSGKLPTYLSPKPTFCPMIWNPLLLDFLPICCIYPHVEILVTVTNWRNKKDWKDAEQYPH